MPVNFNYSKPTTIVEADTATGYSRTAILCYLWQLKLVEEDSQIFRFYNQELDETCFTIRGLPRNSRPQKLWENGQEGFGAKLQHNSEGTIAQVLVKGNIVYSSKWELSILSPTTDS